MKCPKCKTSDLQKNDFNSPLTCPDCKGIWISDKDAANVPESVLVESPSPSPDNASMDNKTGVCPAGHGIMLRAKVDTDNPFYLERCSKCGGIWFDAGEWQRLAQSHLKDNLPDFWTQSWQHKQQKEKDRQHFLALNKRLLGESVFNSIMDLADSLKDHPEKTHALALLRQEITGV
jgi:Zn-finger nucleic acid-binding protein